MNLKICAALAYLLAGITAGGVVYGQLPQNNNTASSAPSSQVSSVPSSSSQDSSESASSVPGDTTSSSSLPQESQAASSSPQSSSSAASSSAGSNSSSSSKASVSSGSNGSKNLSWQDLINQLTNGQKNNANCPNNNNNNSTTTPSKPSTSVPSNNSSSSAVVSGNYAAFQNRVVELVNEQRTANGLKPLTVNATVTKTATLKSEDMAKLNYFDHTSPTYGSPFDMMKQYGISYRTAGENIAKGQTSPEQVMQGWMNSEGHRKNILNSGYTQIGVGIAKNAQGQLVWTQQFIG